MRSIVLALGQRPWLVTVAPLLITAATAAWTAVVSPHSEYGDNWAVYPVLAAFLGVLALHVILIVRGPKRVALLVYAIAHVLFWLPFGIYCLMRISKDSF